MKADPKLLLIVARLLQAINYRCSKVWAGFNSYWAVRVCNASPPATSLPDAASRQLLDEAPPLSQATGTQDSPIFVSDVVRRIKCEIADAFDDKVNDPAFLVARYLDGKGRFRSLQINEFAGVSPSAAYTKFFKNAFNFDAGSQSLTAKTIGFVNQTVSVGASANLGEQAVRTEVVTFSLSVKEIKEQSKHPGENGSVDNSLCSPTDLPGLRGGLGLREWVNSALYPVALKELQFGYHPSPVVSNTLSSPRLRVSLNLAPSLQLILLRFS